MSPKHATRSRSRTRTFTENVARLFYVAYHRLKARNPEPFDRERFEAEMGADYPGHPHTFPVADAFEAALEESHGNAAVFERELRCRLRDIGGGKMAKQLNPRRSG